MFGMAYQVKKPSNLASFKHGVTTAPGKPGKMTNFSSHGNLKV